MSEMNGTAGDCIPGLRFRLMASAKLCAVTASPLLNFAPALIVNVYVLPSFEISGSDAAASGMSLPPSGADLSGKLRSL